MHWSPAAAGFLTLFFSAAFFLPTAHADGDPKRGLYVATAGGCVGCHTEAKPDAPAYAGGRALKTPFGVFYGPNITPHLEAGIGRWTEQNFVQAMRFGRRPDGAHYFPSFPYPSFTQIADQDLSDLWAYLRTLAPSARKNQPHELRFPFGWRALIWGWKLLYFKPGAFMPDPARNATVNRGGYLANALGHCGECHTPRNFLGGPKKDRYFAGAKLGGDATASNLTPTRLKKFTDDYLREVLQTGLTPDGDVLSDAMAEVVQNMTSKLSRQDLDAVIAYLRSLPPLPDEPK